MNRVKRKTSRVRDMVVGDATVVAASRAPKARNPAWYNGREGASMKRPRDSQRQRVYRAEAACPWYHKGQRIETVPEIQAYVDKLLGSTWCRLTFPSGPGRIVVHDGRGGYKARAGEFDIYMPVRMRTVAILLHEVAHTLVNGVNRQLKRFPHPQAPLHPAHGWLFARTELTLVREVLGNDKADELRAAYDRFGVAWAKHASRAKREMTPEQKQAATARLAAWRERKRSAEMFREIASSQPPAERIFIPDCPR